MRSAVAMAISYLIDPETPKNHGSQRPITVKAKRGTIVWSEDGAPVTMCTSHCSNEICEAIIVALSQACPDRAMGGWGRRFRVAIQGENPKTGNSFIWHLFHARPGAGGSSGGDGWHNAGEWHSAGGLKFGSIELAEARFPLHFKKHEFRSDSFGDGQFRGGAGVELELEMETEKPALANTAGDGNRHGSRGMVGGLDSKPHHYELHKIDGTIRELKTKEISVPVGPGDRFIIHSAGGGGWGDPKIRSQSARELDEKNEIIS
jgi:N-methylhydantoinase B